MLKRIVARLFGFDKEIEALRRQVNVLSWDRSFGMWTREAFIQLCDVMPRQTRVVAFIDLGGIHNLNEQWGYEEVNSRIKAAFAIYFRRSDIVARWFSGDEIAILFDSDRPGAERKLKQLVDSAGEQGLTFRCALGEWEVGFQGIEDRIKALSAEVAHQKSAER